MSSNESVKDNNSKVEESATNADADTCVVCFKNVEIYSIGECDHPVCHECSTRMRVLCQQNECPICRHVLGKVIFTYEKMPFRELEAKNRSEYYSKRYKIGFYTNDIQKRFFELLDHPCPKCNALPYRSFQGLRDHVRREHNLYYCDLCVDNLKIFTFERRCYTQSELNLHRTKGDVDNKSHRGHPLCEYCNKRYLDRDELFRHLRREHYFCHFCDADGCNEFYRDYDALAEHFRQDHYLCEEGKCATEQFVGAFRTDIDYKAHVASVHGKTLNKQQAKQTRTLQLEITLGPRGRGGQSEQNLTNIRSGATNEDPNEEIEQFPLYAQQHYSHQRPLNIDSQNVQDFPSLSSGNGSNASTAPLVPFPMRRGISAGFSRTKENFPALGSSSTVPSTSQRSSQQQQPKQQSQQQQQHQAPPISTMVKRTMNPATNSSSTTNGPLSNAQTGNGAISKKSATPKVDFPALPMGKAKKNQQQPLKKAPIVQQSQQQSFHQLHQQQLQHQQQQQQQQHQKQQQRLLEEDMLPAASSNLPTSSVAAKHRGLVDDYVSVSNPKTFQKIQTVQQQADTQASTKERTKAVPKLNSEDFPSLCNNSASNGPPISWTKSISEKKLREQENRKAKVAPAPQLPTSKEPKISMNKLPNDPNTNSNNQKEKKVKDKKPDTTTTNQSKSNAKTKEKQSNNNNNNNNNNDNEENKQDRNLNASPNGISNNNNNNNNSSSNISRDTADVRPPPGFNKGQPENPTSNPVGVPPPGFLSNVTVNSVAKSPNSLTFTSSMGESYSIIPKHQYLQPPDSSTRNQKLVEDFQNAMRSAEGFQQFHLISQKFREGLYKADAYYEHCQAALGADFDRIFPELLVLLPNIGKQQALYLVHAQRLNTMEADDRKSLPQLEVCSMCKQVLLSNDIIAHHKMHDFPAIGKPNVAGKRK